MIMSIFEFLEDYYGEQLDPRTYINHKTARRKYKLMACGVKYAKNHFDLIKCGKIVYVRDTYGIIFPYFNPKAEEMTDECILTEEEIEEIKMINDYANVFEMLPSMSTYELGELLSEYKYVPSVSRMIKRELAVRGKYDTKIYKLRKESDKNEVEESDFYDKYQRRQKIKCRKP